MLLDRGIYKTCVLIPKIKLSLGALTSVRKLSSSQDEGKFKGKYDVIIAGGGMVGCTLACIMGKTSLLSNLKVLLLEGSPDKKFELKPEYSNRVVALSQNTKSIMTSINVWSHVEQMRLQAVRHMQVWDACSDALITFSSTDILDDDVAYIVENDVLLHAVNTELRSPAVKNVDVVYGAKIQDYDIPTASHGTPESTVKMTNGDTYSCQLLIGADGANSAVRKAMGVQYLSWNYDQMGVVATLLLAEVPERRHDQRASTAPAASRCALLLGCALHCQGRCFLHV